MKRLSAYFRFTTNEATTAILAAVVAVSFFAFVAGAGDLVIGLLFIGLFTAILEARMTPVLMLMRRQKPSNGHACMVRRQKSC